MWTLQTAPQWQSLSLDPSNRIRKTFNHTTSPMSVSDRMVLAHRIFFRRFNLLSSGRFLHPYTVQYMGCWKGLCELCSLYTVGKPLGKLGTPYTKPLVPEIQIPLSGPSDFTNIRLIWKKTDHLESQVKCVIFPMIITSPWCKHFSWIFRKSKGLQSATVRHCLTM